MPKRILALLVLAATALALVAGASARTNSGSIRLVAYSTPRDGLRQADPGVPEDGRRQGHVVLAVATAPPASRPAP